MHLAQGSAASSSIADSPAEDRTLLQGSAASSSIADSPAEDRAFLDQADILNQLKAEGYAIPPGLQLPDPSIDRENQYAMIKAMIQVDTESQPDDVLPEPRSMFTAESSASLDLVVEEDITEKEPQPKGPAGQPVYVYHQGERTGEMVDTTQPWVRYVRNKVIQFCRNLGAQTIDFFWRTDTMGNGTLKDIKDEATCTLNAFQMEARDLGNIRNQFQSKYANLHKFDEVPCFQPACGGLPVHFTSRKEHGIRV